MQKNLQKTTGTVVNPEVDAAKNLFFTINSIAMNKN